jgi:hypothetical protein
MIMIEERFIRPSDLLELYENTPDLNMDNLSVPVPVIRQNIKDLSTVEAREVVHAKWQKHWCDSSMIGHEYEECPICGCMILDTEKFWDCKFCPNCGPEMQ